MIGDAPAFRLLFQSGMVSRRERTSCDEQSKLQDAADSRRDLAGTRARRVRLPPRAGGDG